MPENDTRDYNQERMTERAMGQNAMLADYERGVYPEGRSRDATAWFLAMGEWLPDDKLPEEAPGPYGHELWSVIADALQEARLRLNAQGKGAVARAHFRNRFLFRAIPSRRR